MEVPQSSPQLPKVIFGYNYLFTGSGKVIGSRKSFAPHTPFS